MDVSFGTKDNKSLNDLCCMEERVEKSIEDAHCDLLCVISDSIPFEDEIAHKCIDF